MKFVDVAAVSTATSEHFIPIQKKGAPAGKINPQGIVDSTDVPSRIAAAVASIAAHTTDIAAIRTTANAAIPTSAKGVNGGVAAVDADGNIVANGYASGRGAPLTDVLDNESIWFRGAQSVAGTGILGILGLVRHTVGTGALGAAVRLSMRFGGAVLGQILWNAKDNFGGLDFLGSSGKGMKILSSGRVQIPDLMANVSPTFNVRYYGAVGDGVTDDTAAIAATVAAAAASKYAATIHIPQDFICLVKSEIYCWMANKLRITGPGKIFASVSMKIGQVVLQFTNKTTPTLRGGGVTFDDNITIEASGSGPGPTLIESLHPSGMDFMKATLVSYGSGDSILRLGAMWNCRAIDLKVWGGGTHRVRKLMPAGNKFKVDVGVRQVTSTTDVFDQTDVGEYIYFGIGGGQQYIIESVQGPRAATLTEAPVEGHASAGGAWEGVVGTMTLANPNQLVLNSARYTSADIGRWIWVSDAIAGQGGSKGVLRAKITAVDGVNITLDAPCTRAVTKTPIFLSPAIEILGHLGANDAIWWGLHLEEVKGLAIGITGGANVYFNTSKIHGMKQDTENDNVTALCLYWNNTHGYWLGGDWEGISYCRFGHATFRGMRVSATVADLVGVLGSRMPFISYEGNSEQGSLRVGEFKSANQATQNGIDSFLKTDGTGTLEFWGPVNGSYIAGKFNDRSTPYKTNFKGGLRASAIDGTDIPEAANDTAAGALTPPVPLNHFYFNTTIGAVVKRKT